MPEYRDPIHGLINLSKKEVEIIDLPVFQRLRRIRQLALAMYAYSGALHTRFEHSIGTMHVAGRIARQIGLNSDEEESVRLAALLHDIGHGPFSHVAEYILQQHSEHFQSGSREKIHEKITSDIIENHKDTASILDKESRDRISQIIKGSTQRSVSRDIVSSTLDADKLDYLLRDAYYAGVKYGIYDLDKIIESLHEKSIPPNQSMLAIREEGIFALEQLVLAKHHMNRQVYAHKIRSITDAMLVRAVHLAIDGGDDTLKNIFSYEESSDFLNRYCAIHDDKLLEYICESTVESAAEFGRWLWERKLLKVLYEFPLSDISEDVYCRAAMQKKLTDQKGDTKEVREAKFADREHLEKEIADFAKIDKNWVIFQISRRGVPRYGAIGAEYDPEEILVTSSDPLGGEGQRSDHLSDLDDSVLKFQNLKEAQTIIQVFARIDNQVESNEIADIRSKINDAIVRKAQEG